MTCVVLLLAALTVSSLTGAQNYPQRPVRMVVATTAGSAPDTIARLLAGRLSEHWGQQVVVDNRSGASGLIGAEIVAKAAPDAYTLYLATMTQLISTTLFERYALAKEFAAVSFVASTPYVLVVNAASPLTSVAELLKHARANPGKLLYGSAGVGSTPHMCIELFTSLAGITLVHIPYKSAAVAMPDLFAGQIQLLCGAAPGMLPFAKSGKVRLLGVSTRAPTPLAPGLTPIHDTVPGFELGGWYGMLAPRGTPQKLVALVNDSVGRVLRESETQQRLLVLGADPAPSTPREYEQFLERETERWRKVLKEANIKPVQ